jgi:hypothetical protein
MCVYIHMYIYIYTGNLSNDTENSIRTNSTIFLGRIAQKLKEGVRQRVLCASFSKVFL